MRVLHPFQKHFCLLFLSLAVLTTYVTLKNKYNSVSTYFTNNDTFYNVSYREFEDKFDFEADNELYLQYTNLTEPELVERNEESDVIYILGLFELSTKWGSRVEGESEVIAARLAVDHINSLNILPGYELRLLVNDTRVSFA